MLSKSHRLTTAEFSSLFKSGRRFHTPHLQVIAAPAPQLKAAVVVSKKLVKSAVKRNLLRRQIFAAIQEIQKENPQTQQLIFIVKTPLLTSSFTEIRAAVAQFFVQRRDKHVE